MHLVYVQVGLYCTLSCIEESRYMALIRAVGVEKIMKYKWNF